MLGNHEEAGRPSPFTKTMSCFFDDGGGLMAGKKTYEIGEYVVNSLGYHVDAAACLEKFLLI